MARERISESRAEQVARELLAVRGWNLARPPKGNILWKNEYRDYPHILEALDNASKNGGGASYPDFLVVTPDLQPLIVGEAKADERNIDQAVEEACKPYGEAFVEKGLRVLAAGVAGNDNSNIAVVVKKRSHREWKPIEYRQHPIQWIPTPDQTALLLADDRLFDLRPEVPSPQVLAKRGDEINRLLRECSISDAHRPALLGAILLALWHSRGQLRVDPDHVLKDINQACRDAFAGAGKPELAGSLMVPAVNRKLAVKAPRICYLLRLLGVTTLTAEHDYLGQLYETFFRLLGHNTIGQYFTPRHITRFMVDLCDVGRSDFVVDPTCGTGGFLIAALCRMIGDQHLTREQIGWLVKGHLLGFESEPITAALCVANMILRGDGTTGVLHGDCFTHPDYPEGEASIVVGNPPFPHAKTDTPAEKFVSRGLQALETRGTLAMIVPSSLLVSKQQWRKRILLANTLKGVITLPGELFQPYASSPTGIVILEKGIPHDNRNPTFFCRVTNDGYTLQKKVRVPRPGEQLTTADEAFRSRRSIPGFCTSAPLTEEEWSPGAYIESPALTADTLKAEIDGLIRQQVAFHASFAHKLHQLQLRLDRGIFQPLPYSAISSKKGMTSDRTDRLGGLFKIYYGQQELENKKHLQPDSMPVISSAGTNNGCYGFYSFGHLAPLIKPPFVTAPRTGSIGEAFVQLWPCGVTSDCLILEPKRGTEEEDLYIAAAVVRLERWRFDYSRKITPKRLAIMKTVRDEEVRSWTRDRLAVAREIMRTVVNALSFGEDLEIDKEADQAD